MFKYQTIYNWMTKILALTLGKKQQNKTSKQKIKNWKIKKSKKDKIL